MEKEHDEARKILLGLLIGSAVAAGAYYCVQAAQNRKTPVLKKVGKTIVDVGEMIENISFDSASDMIESVGEKLPSGSEVVNQVAEWVDAGLSLWKKYKRRM